MESRSIIRVLVRNVTLLAILSRMTPLTVSFSTLPLPPTQLANLEALGYTAMTPIQADSLPLLLASKDVIAQAKTGSGKTAAFGIALLNSLNQRLFATQALVLCPTRELADQVTKELRRLARFADNIKIVTLCGGMPTGPQLAALENGVHVVVGTPGRVLKHLQKESLQLDKLNTLVLDEADRMLDMGFHDSIVEVIHFVPPKRQTLLFSATYSDEIRKLSRSFQKNPAEVTVESVHAETQIEQHFFEIEKGARAEAVVALLNHYLYQAEEPESAVLFCNTKIACDEIAAYLREHGFHALALHGDLEQRERDQVLVQFANRSCPVLVATDVAARGLDIKDLAVVINVELSHDPEVHIHRIGRTGRAGQTGLALSLCSPNEVHRANAIEDYQQQKLQWSALPQTPAPAKMPLPKMMTINISGGRKDKLRPGDILGALTGDAGFAGSQIGKIAIFELQSFVAVDYAIAQEAVQRLRDGKIKGRAFKVRAVSG
jgi:ATP-independent RNA helicase DbpA